MLLNHNDGECSNQFVMNQNGYFSKYEQEVMLSALSNLG